MRWACPLDQVILRSTWNPAKEIHREDLGNLSVGSPADVAVFRVEKGSFGFLDQLGGRFDGSQRLLCEPTLRDGNVVYDLNGLPAMPWEKLPARPPGGRGGRDAETAPKNNPRADVIDSIERAVRPACAGGRCP